jgi:hypothetical protein
MKLLTFADIQIGLPARWKNETNIALSGPVEDDFAASIAITRDVFDENISLDDFFPFAGEQLKAGLGEQGYRLISETRTTFAGLPAGQRIYQFNLDNSHTIIQQMQISLVRGSDAITVTCTNLAKNFAKTMPAFKQMLDSLRWAVFA